MKANRLLARLRFPARNTGRRRTDAGIAVCPGAFAASYVATATRGQVAGRSESRTRNVLCDLRHCADPHPKTGDPAGGIGASPHAATGSPLAVMAVAHT